MIKSRHFILAGIAVISLTLATTDSSRAEKPLYTLKKTVPLGGGIKWDYLHFDSALNRVFISHGTELTVLDGKTGEIVGHVTGLSGSHGIAIDPAAGIGYADSRKSQSISIFSLKTLKTIKTIPALPDADGMAYDAGSGQFFVAGGDANAALVVSAKTNRRITTINLGGSPESLISDGAGAIYINLKDKSQIVKISTKTNTIVARWPVGPCVGPVGLAIDVATRRLFSSCENASMVVVDANSGKVVTSLPIGRGSDSIAFDAIRKLALSSNGDGTLSIIREVDAQTFKVLPAIKTAPGARTLAVDPATGQVFLVTATVQSMGPPKHSGGAKSYVFVPGTLEALIFGPTS